MLVKAGVYGKELAKLGDQIGEVVPVLGDVAAGVVYTGSALVEAAGHRVNGDAQKAKATAIGGVAGGLTTAIPLVDHARTVTLGKIDPTQIVDDRVQRMFLSDDEQSGRSGGGQMTDKELAALKVMFGKGTEATTHDLKAGNTAVVTAEKFEKKQQEKHELV